MTEFDLPRERKVGHLTVLRPPRTVTPKEFRALPPQDQMAVLRSASGRQKYDLLQSIPDAERLVRRLPAQDIYLMIKELGLTEVADLIPLVDTEQFTTFLDLDCWRGDRLDRGSVVQWLAVLAESGEEKVLETFQEMEFDLLTLIFEHLVTVVRGPEDYLDEDARLEAVQRDGGYELSFHDSESGKLVGAILEVFLRRDSDLFSRLLTAVRWEQGALLEEENYRLRNLRLLELGFPDPEEAPGIHAWLDPDGFDPADWRRAGAPDLPPSEAPSFMLSASAPRNLLADVLAAGIDGATAWELTFLLNRVMTADQADLGSYERVQEETAEVYRTLNLALEHLCGADVEKAAALVGGCYLQPLFRLGFSLTLSLQRRARALRKSPILPYLDEPFRALLEALLRRKPAFYHGLEEPTRAGERPFTTLREVRLAEVWLDRLEAQRRLFEEKLPFELVAPDQFDLAGCQPDQPEDLSLSTLLLTALANRVLGRPFLPRPVPAAELVALHGKVCRGKTIDPDLRRETISFIESLEPAAGAFGEYCLDRWEEDFCPIEQGEIDPRFVSTLIVRK